ncbi:MAG TPA: hypothetical protein VHK90_09300 [Thermoanaerobaculia bacterium]|nr:hypothetical protein [Thermoanaerobaculia bacterium]
MRHRAVRLLVLLALLAVGTSSPLQGGPWYGEIRYYAEPSLSTYVGYFVRYCNGYEDSDGTVTPYYRETPFDCDPEW